MLDPELFAAFSLATTALILMPGPIVTLVVANTLAHGQRTGLATVAGASTGNAVLIVVGAMGLTTVLALVAGVFDWLRWLGAAYLFWLGFLHWRAAVRGAVADVPAADTAPQGVYWHGFVVAITNPKTILFYVAFFPQFLAPSLPAAPQLAAMSVVFLVLAVTIDSGYSLLAGRVRPWLTDTGRTRVRHGITGTLLIGTGLSLALLRRT